MNDEIGDPGLGEPLGVAEPVLDHEQRVRLEALRYAVNEEAATYFAIMRTFTGTMSGLLSDQSASEVAGRLAALGLDLEPDVVDERLRYLAERGNLAYSPRETEARSIREYAQSRARYQLTQRGELVHRLVEEIVGASDAAREVSSEMLGAIGAGLQSLLDLSATDLDTVQPEQISQPTITLFAQFERLVESTREFYAYLSEVLRRFDLDRTEFQAFKSALVGYLQRFVDEIALHMPQLCDLLTRLAPHVAPLLDRANAGQRLLSVDGSRARRDRGLDADDWTSLRSWFLGEAGRQSDAAQVRALATDAMSALLANLRRIAANDDHEAGRYRDLLKLAGWFEGIDDATAHAMWASAFGLYSSRHVGFLADDAGRPVPATTSWWHGPVAEVPVTLRQQGDRAMRGKPGRPADFSLAKAHRIQERTRAEESRRAALVELASHRGRLDNIRVSDAARAVLLDLYAHALMSDGRTSASSLTASFLTASAMTNAPLVDSPLVDGGLRVVVERTPGAGTTVSSPDGSLEFCDLTLHLEPARLTDQSVEEQIA
jgi:uncharacterized protein (TIGR02677 family)